jgi:uncharacterized protein (TIGR02996 family)
MTEDEAFMRTIVDRPGDDLPRLVYADWLDERDDLRGLYLREELTWVKAGRPDAGHEKSVLSWVSASLDPVWVARVSRPPVGVCCDHIAFTDCGPRLTTEDVEGLQQRLRVRLPSEFVAFLLNYNAGEVTPSDLPPNDPPSALCEAVENGFFPVEHERRFAGEFESKCRGYHTMLSGEKALLMTRLVPLACSPDSTFFLGVGGERTGRVYHYDEWYFEKDTFDPTYVTERAATLPLFLHSLSASW